MTGSRKNQSLPVFFFLLLNKKVWQSIILQFELPENANTQIGAEEERASALYSIRGNTVYQMFLEQDEKYYYGYK